MKLKSWRWSRLTEPSALKRLVTHPNWIVPLIMSLLMLWFASDEAIDFSLIFTWLCRLCWLILGVAVLQNICCADEYYEIKSGKKIIRKIYLYTSGYFKRNIKVNMVMKEKNYEIHQPIEAHHYDFEKWDDFTSFLFEIDNEYYYSSPVAEAQPLGRCIGATVFSPSGKEKQVTILDGCDILTLEADAFFLNGVYIPPLASQQIYANITNKKMAKPQDYLVAKHGKKYNVYGLYYLNRPTCLQLRISNVIFKEGAQEVILQWNNKHGYQEIFRSNHSVKRAVSDIFVELTYRHGIGGTIRKFNEQTQKLDLLYKGYFHAIDFDSGSIIGDQGYEFVPNT